MKHEEKEYRAMKQYHVDKVGKVGKERRQKDRTGHNTTTWWANSIKSHWHKNCNYYKYRQLY